MGTFFTEVPLDPYRVPRLIEIGVPEFPGGYAIWGALGRDDRGRIWFGVSDVSPANASAHLCRYDPETGGVVDRGDVVGELQRAGLSRDGQAQAKIHSKMVAADDGLLYFASLDEAGESSDGRVFPTWGGHLWRIDPETGAWEHLAATRAALIAVAGYGRWIYALGYFGHVVYRYDVQTGELIDTTVGSVGGHVSRNLLCDAHGHVYVPRVVELAAASPAREVGPEVTTWQGRRFRSTLVELDTELHEVAETPLPHYAPTPDFDSHGLVGFTHLVGGSIVFTTHTGRLYRIDPGHAAPAIITDLGWLHPDGASYPACLDTFAGERYVTSLASRDPHGGRRDYQWLVYDLESRDARAMAFPADDADLFARRDLLLYGSNTRSAGGDCYFAGRYVNGGEIPVLLRASFAPRPE